MAEVKLEGPEFAQKEEFPNASNAAKQLPSARPVARGEVRKPLWKYLTGWLFADDVGDINKDVIMPALKDLAYNIITTAIYGDRRGGQRPRGGYSGQNYDYNYNYTTSARTDYRNTGSVNRQVQQTQRISSLNDYKDIVVQSRQEAEQIIAELGNLCAMYGYATISDLWQAVGITRDNPMESKWGWRDVSGTQIKPSFGNWRFIWPAAEPLE